MRATKFGHGGNLLGNHGIDRQRPFNPFSFAEHGDFVSGLYMALFVMNFVIVGVLLFATRWIALVTQNDDSLLGMATLCFAMVGTYSTSYRITDPIIAAAFGVFGYFLRTYNIPMVPITLGIILGPIAEERFRQALGASAGDLSVFITRPISAIILVAILLLIGRGIQTWHKEQNLAQAAA